MRRGLYTLSLSSCNNFSFSVKAQIKKEESAPDNLGGKALEIHARLFSTV